MKKFLLFILINIFLICNANAITLIEAIKEAYDNNPKLNAERENLKISKENINISKSNFLPTVTWPQLSPWPPDLPYRRL